MGILKAELFFLQNINFTLIFADLDIFSTESG